ncbi:3-deoxy-7-phosphoheptulonate synthase [Chromatiales bacterium (ex Bugula neritina AB1)]|nr:3-deoxy-7-phosphoheptulonate synthase [Chromatiales bacterium (ex Bugula neritina AB1)]
MQINTDDLRIKEMKELLSPAKLIEEVPVSAEISQTVFDSRMGIRHILDGADDRLVVVVGPCSIHDPEAGIEYAAKLAPLHQSLKDNLLIVMRVYFEKPRTTVGWKGLINDPDLDDSFSINKGLKTARTLLRDINALGLPAGTEFLDLISPQYIADLVGWGAIGARTTESQGHRELASGISAPVGFKNGTGGSVQIAVDAICSASNPHHFLSVTKEGGSAIFSTSGNNDCHLILRGGPHTNYDAASVDDASGMMEKSGVSPNIMIDFSHANSRKKFKRQRYVCRDVCSQLSDGDRRIMGVMIESNLVEGRQDQMPDRDLVRGQSITDPCIGWDDTVEMLQELHAAVAARRLEAKEPA